MRMILYYTILRIIFFSPVVEKRMAANGTQMCLMGTIRGFGQHAASELVHYNLFPPNLFTSIVQFVNNLHTHFVISNQTFIPPFV